MTRKILVVLPALLLSLPALQAHDMFLKLKTYFLPSATSVSVALINGTFEESGNAIARNRMIDVTIAGPGAERMFPDTTQWHDEDSTAYLSFTTGAPGTYTAGVSTAPRVIELSAEDFNEYLQHDGVLDVLEKRREEETLDLSAAERYSKHVKAVFQVGDERSGAYDAEFSYPVEIIPQENPYELSMGDELEVLVLLRGVPLANQLVYASHEGYHGHDETGAHIEAVKTRTDENGRATIPLSEIGRWYVRLIHMAEVDEDEVDYESNWATLTFEVR